MALAAAVTLRCRSEAEASKGGGVPLKVHLGRASFEARKGSHLQRQKLRFCAGMTGQLS
ncbi:hypothetical protein [Bradyrhizobium liaoningense]|uniref:hypothetical protein n=1 Tax=Bradyrhizobium liaoningense TaxID=43992 RepID=UPI001BA728D1|nr:hypothetical protein [Bradyrhizobium liaoningense]MBR0817523.1 hypothetical protein [Bradyrhizobium liaoningense]